MTAKRDFSLYFDDILGSIEKIRGYTHLTFMPQRGYNPSTMRTQTVTKDETIKFNVSPRFKKMAQKKAEIAGVNLSDLGRFLFGAYIHDLIPPPTVRTPLDMAVQEAEAELRAGKTTTIKNKTELKDFLDDLKENRS